MREALAFLTVLGRSTTPTPRALRWFPIVGIAIGSAVGGSWWLFTQLFPPTVAAALAIAADLALTGMLHFDGLVDSADGLLPHLSRERRLEVMRTPDAGAFGVGAALVVIIVRIACLASMSPEVLLVAGIWCGARAVVAVAPARLRYARDAGLATAFIGGRGGWLPLVAVVPATVVIALATGWPALATMAATIIGVVVVLAFAHVRIGGFTGDVLGASILVGETAGLVVASARW
jgi:adenosylcobinamide-GDP ribazoletransferase